jgi:hypothetical protein
MKRVYQTQHEFAQQQKKRDNHSFDVPGYESKAVAESVDRSGKMPPTTIAPMLAV